MHRTQHLCVSKRRSTSSLYPTRVVNARNIMTTTSVSQPPGHGPVSGLGINYTDPREVLLKVVILVFYAVFINICFVLKYFEENNIRECVEKLISLVQFLITNLNVILYLSTCHTIHANVLILFRIMP
jgi:hypothetical protein